MITVKNRKSYKAAGLYIGRGTVFGNKFMIGRDGNRAQVITKYLQWLRGEYKARGKVYRALMELVDGVADGNDLVLICSCAPQKCHGDVLKKAIEALVNKQKLVSSNR